MPNPTNDDDDKNDDNDDLSHDTLKRKDTLNDSSLSYDNSILNSRK